MSRVDLYPLGIIRKSLYLAKQNGNISSSVVSECLNYLDIYSDLYKVFSKMLKVELSDNLEWSE